MTKERKRVAQLVRRGAKWLDKHKPGWVASLDGASLNLAYPCSCVLGQLDEDDYYKACYDAGLSRSQAQALGFSAPDGVKWGTLTAEWKRVIRARESLSGHGVNAT